MSVTGQATIQPCLKLLHILIIRVTSLKRATFRIHQHIEWKCCGSKLHRLQVAPLVTHRSEFTSFFTIFLCFHHKRLCQIGLVIHVELDKHILVFHDVSNRWICENCCLHLATIHTSMTRKINHHRQAMQLCISHSLLIIRKHRLHRMLWIKIEVLCFHGWGKGTDCLQRSTPQSWNHIDSKCKRDKCHEKARDGCLLMHLHLPIPIIFLFIVRETNPSHKISTQQCCQHNPERQKDFSIQQSPPIGKICNGEELKSKCQLHKTKCHLHHIHPIATLRH